MVSKLALLSNLLLACAVLSVPSPQLEAVLARRRENRKLQNIQHVDPLASNDSNTPSSGGNWAGAAWQEDGVIFTAVTGTFLIPKPSGDPGSGASIWGGLDGFTCFKAIAQVGITFIVYDGDEVEYAAWHEWFPDHNHFFDGIDISAGHEITLTVTTSSETSGTATIENKTTQQIRSVDISAPDPNKDTLCRENAEWIVEVFQEEDIGVIPLANFGTVTFTSAMASGPGFEYGTLGANMLNIEQNGKVLTAVSTYGNTVAISYRS